MARTPLFGFLRRSLGIARHSLHSPMPLDELLERGRDRAALSRRELLLGAASAAAVTAYAGCAPARILTPGVHQEEVLIFGAGIAGLTAAYRLQQAGVRARVFDAANRTGGRMFSLRDHFADGQVAELGGELIDTGHKTIRALAGELGIALDDFAQEDPGVDRDVWFIEGARRSEREVVEAFRPLAARIERDLATFQGDGDVTYKAHNGGGRFDFTTLAKYLDEAGMTGWFRKLLDVAYTAEYGLETDRQSSLNLLFLIDPEPEPFRIFGESDERFHVRGGNDLITRALAERLERPVETGAALEAIRKGSDGRLVCTLRRAGTSQEIAGAHVVLAMPFTMLRSVQIDLELPAVKRRAIDQLGYGTNAKLMVSFSERVWRTRHRSNGSVVTDLPFQSSWETSRLQPGASGLLTNFTGGAHGLELGQGTPAHQAALFVSDLERIFPGISAHREGMKEARFHWPSHPFTKGSYACYLPGQWTAFRGVEGEPVGNLHFAGEHCSLDAQGFMEGGCETGEAAAREVLADLKLAPAAAAA
ncbi:MAG: flavin monoamine oxidase family protein [Thermoanaerobaculia bacterium]